MCSIVTKVMRHTGKSPYKFFQLHGIKLQKHMEGKISEEPMQMHTCLSGNRWRHLTVHYFVLKITSVATSHGSENFHKCTSPEPAAALLLLHFFNNLSLRKRRSCVLTFEDWWVCGCGVVWCGVVSWLNF